MLRGVDDESSTAVLGPIDARFVRDARSSAAAPKSQPTLRPPAPVPVGVEHVRLLVVDHPSRIGDLRVRVSAARDGTHAC